MKAASLLAVVSLLAACATRPLPDLPPSHPASPAAQESPTRRPVVDLSEDEATRTTAQLLVPPSAPQP